MRIAESRASCAPFIAFFAMSGRVGIVVSHSKRKERVLNGAQSIEEEPRGRWIDHPNNRDTASDTGMSGPPARFTSVSF